MWPKGSQPTALPPIKCTRPQEIRPLLKVYLTTGFHGFPLNKAFLNPDFLGPTLGEGRWTSTPKLVGWGEIFTNGGEK